MIINKYKYIGLFLMSLGFLSCETTSDLEPILKESLPEVALNTGDLDFSNYVAVGASFTAGFTDGALFMKAQENSFPNILAKQFNNNSFTQPLMNDNFGGLAVGGSRVTEPRLVFGGAGPVPLESIIGSVTVSTDLAVNNPTGTMNNLGVPGAKSFHLIAPGFGNLTNLSLGLANPYAVRLTGATPNASVLELAVAKNPSFFTLSEVGGNDVLGYATSGGDSSNEITDIATFTYATNTLVNALTANGAKGVIANVPNITSLSYFTTVPYNPVPLDEASATALNTAYASYNAGIVQVYTGLVQNSIITQDIADQEIAKRTISFVADEDNAVVMIDENLRDLTSFNQNLINLRQTTPEDLITLPTASALTAGAGTATPLTDTSVLTPEEQEEIATAVQGYNDVISSIATSKGLALVDLNAILTEASTVGLEFDNYTMNTSLVFGGLVSLDGVHLTARGYALMANEFLKAIDKTYGTNFEEATDGFAKAADYPTNYSPSL